MASAHVQSSLSGVCAAQRKACNEESVAQTVNESFQIPVAQQEELSKFQLFQTVTCLCFYHTSDWPTPPSTALKVMGEKLSSWLANSCSCARCRCAGAVAAAVVCCLPRCLCMCPTRFSGVVSCSQTCTSPGSYGASAQPFLYLDLFAFASAPPPNEKPHCILQFSPAVQYLC